MTALTLSLPSTPEAASAACAFVEEAAAELGLPSELCDRMVLAAGEVVDNAAGHGHRYDAGRLVTLTLKAEAATVAIVVEQDAVGPSQQAIEEAGLPQDPMDTRGRGLFLIRALADRVEVLHQGRCLVLSWDV